MTPADLPILKEWLALLETDGQGTKKLVAGKLQEIISELSDTDPAFERKVGY